MKASTNGKPLRFAALIRVSTEKQEEKGTSLLNQRQHNEQSVKSLGGKIVEWYGGQEHGTPGYEKQEVDRLIRDASRKKFDAVIIYHAWRWSRDNAKSKEGLEVFRQNNVRFFVGTFEYDLFNPQHKFFLGVAAEIGELNAGTQTQQSIENKILALSDGDPRVVGKLPFGRYYDPERRLLLAKPGMKAKMEKAAADYLKGGKGNSSKDIARRIGIHVSRLTKVFKKDCGDVWVVNFTVPRLNIKRDIPVPMERLLPEKTIEALRKEIATRRTSGRDTSRECDPAYELRKKVFCGECGNLLAAYPSGRYRYYKHTNNERSKACPHAHKPKLQVPAPDLEGTVIKKLFDLFGNPKAIERAMEEARPNKQKVKKAQAEITQIEAELQRIEKKRAFINDRVGEDPAEGGMTEEEAKTERAKLFQREQPLLVRRDGIEQSIANLPKPEDIKQAAVRLLTVIHGGRILKVAVDEDGSPFDLDHLKKTGKWKGYRGGNDPKAFEELTLDDRANLLKLGFGSPQPDDSPSGVYVWRHKKVGKSWTWLVKLKGAIPLRPGLKVFVMSSPRRRPCPPAF